MLELLSTYSVHEIIVFIVLLFFAFKGFVEAINWCKDLYNKKFNKDLDAVTQQKKLEQFYNECTQQYNSLDEKLNNLISSFDKNFNDIEEQINVLIESDKDDIKSWLVEKYNFYKSHPTIMISMHMMDTIEKRYGHYKDEGGNSYIDEIIMPGLREMAKEEQRVEI